jgi:hypothetical protein
MPTPTSAGELRGVQVWPYMQTLRAAAADAKRGCRGHQLLCLRRRRPRLKAALPRRWSISGPAVRRRCATSSAREMPGCRPWCPLVRAELRSSSPTIGRASTRRSSRRLSGRRSAIPRSTPSSSTAFS